jgi:altronate hydrolase
VRTTATILLNPHLHRYSDVRKLLGDGCKSPPSIKRATNSAIFRKMSGDMVINCGIIATGESAEAENGAEILDYLLAVASRKKSKNEELGYGDMESVPWHIGAVI